jgi:hypothetical protein
MTAIFERYAQKTPVGLMTRAALEFALEPSAVDALFHEHAERQYERKLLFSTTIDLMALVVCGVHPSVHAAHKQLREAVGVSVTALYEKLAGIETGTTEALVAHSAARLRPVIAALGTPEPWLEGFRVRVLDGNHIAATERRLQVLRKCAAGPLPGQTLVVLEPEFGLAVQIVACEDGHAQERSLLAPVIDAAEPTDVYIADRNFCTLGFLFGLAQRPSHFAIRQHAKLPVTSSGTLRRRGRTETGEIFEQPITLRMGEDELHLRRIVIRLDTPTRDGDREMAVITNLPSEVGARVVADLYRRRWSIETLFARVERNLQSEIAALGYPRAALFTFGVALVAANVFAVVHAGMESAKASVPAAAAMPLSDFAIIEEARAVQRGMDVMLDDDVWEPFHTMSPGAFAKLLKKWAVHIDWPCFRKSVRGPKKATPKRTRFKDKPHVSTARLLAGVAQ